MDRFKRLLLSLCLVSVFSVGFLSVGSLTTYAAEKDMPFLIEDFTDFYFNTNNPIPYYFRDKNKNNLLSGNTSLNVSGSHQSNYIYNFNNKALSGVNYFYLGNYDVWSYPMLVPSLYDYYLVSACTSFNASSGAVFSFVPDDVYVTFVDCDTTHQHFLTDVKSSHLDTGNSQSSMTTVGFVTTGKLPDECSSSIINFIGFRDNATGTIPANISMFFKIVAFPKGTDSNDVSNAIISRLDTLISESNDLETAIGQLEQTLEETINEQYEMTEDEDFGVGEITDQVEEKLGVLAFTSDTLVSFLDLFSTDGSSGTSLTFPGFSITLADGQTYQVWPDYTYDLKELESQFGFLITTIRSITVLCVWLALFRYLGKAYDQLIRGK